VIENLQAVNNPLIRKFKKQELQPIKENLAFHSPEVSEMNMENPEGKCKIVIKNPK